MGKYGAAALLAATKTAERRGTNPRDTWNEVMKQVFPDAVASQTKSCPRDAFLSLCELGVVKGVPPGTYTKSLRNKEYIGRALRALRADPRLTTEKGRLWAIAVEGADKRENGQLDVLVELWEAKWVK